MARLLFRLTVNVYESPSYPIVQHRFLGESASEAEGYYRSHLETDHFLRAALDGKFVKADGSELPLRIEVKPIERVREFAGLSVVVENQAGSFREWKGGATLMRYDYGFLEDAIGGDGEEVDVYLGPDENASHVYVVHQRLAPNFDKHDEDKVFFGFASEAAAKEAYLLHRNDGDQTPGPYGGMTAIPMEEFKRKMARRTGTGKIRAERAPGTLITFDQGSNRWRTPL